MEEQRARQEAEATATTTNKEAEAEGVPAVGTAAVGDDDAMLQKALSMSMDTTEAEVNLEAMTEEEQVNTIQLNVN